METTQRWRTVAAVAGALALSLLPRPAAGQDGAEVLRTALDRYEDRLEGVRTVTIVQETEMPMGTRTTTEERLVKRTSAGRSTLVPENDSAAAGEVPLAAAYARFDEFAGHASLRGRSTVDGRDAYVVHLGDLQDVDLGPGSVSGGDGGFEADSATLYIGSDRYLLRRAEIHGRTSMSGRERPVSVRASLRDFREVEGFVYPYVTEAHVRVEGLGRQMRAMMKQMQQAVEDSAQRAMMRQAAAAMSDDGMRVVTRVQEVRVNEGAPPEGD